MAITSGEASNDEPIAGIKLLMFEKYLMDIVGVGAASLNPMAQNLKDMPDPLGIINVRIDPEFQCVVLGEERELKIAVMFTRLEASGW